MAEQLKLETSGGSPATTMQANFTEKLHDSNGQLELKEFLMSLEPCIKLEVK